MKCTTFRNFASALLFVSSLAIVSCNSGEPDTSDGDTTDTTATATSQDTNQPASAEATIASTYPDTSVTGNATFATVNGKVKMMLNITVPSKAH